MLKDDLNTNDIDLADIARGRRITAVAASELELVPRRSERPKPPSPLLRWKRQVTQSVIRILRQF